MGSSPTPGIALTAPRRAAWVGLPTLSPGRHVIEHHLAGGDGDHGPVVLAYLGTAGRRPRADLTIEQLSELAGALLDGLVARVEAGAIARRDAAVAASRALASWTVVDEAQAAEPAAVEDDVRRLDRALAGCEPASERGLRLAIELMALAPRSTFAFWRARRCAERLLEEPDVRATALGERAWTHAAEMLAMADGDRQLAEEVARAVTGGGHIRGRVDLLRSTWLLLRLEWFDAALAQLAAFRARGDLSVEDASFADALQGYALAAVGPVEEAIAAGRRAMAGAGIGVHLGAAVAIRCHVREGRLDDAAAVLDAVPPPPRPATMGATALLIARGTLAAAAGRHTEALDALTGATDHLRRVGNRNPAGWPWLEPTVRALIGLGQRRRAATVFEQARPHALRWGTPLVLAELDRASALLAEQPSPAGALTPRVREVALLVADGLQDREIAERLGLSPRTVHRHVAAALAATGSRNRVELALAVRRSEPAFDS